MQHTETKTQTERHTDRQEGTHTHTHRHTHTQKQRDEQVPCELPAGPLSRQARELLQAAWALDLHDHLDPQLEHLLSICMNE